jgi:glycosyltransferase involved in cell wall biosynthesis
MENPLISICISNYNMAAYLKSAITSVVDQLDSRFEVVVVDDGSSDNSVALLREIEKEKSLLRVFPYQRSSTRYLGETRNLSIRHARGKYVVLHVDADDEWDEGIVDWCLKAMSLSQNYNDEVYISGKQINFVAKEYIIRFGGYRNIYYTEDRDLWARLAARGSILFVDHPVFRKRMPLATRDKLKKIIKVNWYVLLNDLRCGASVATSIPSVCLNAFTHLDSRGRMGGVLRLFMILPGIFWALRLGALPDYRPILTFEEILKYRTRNTKTFEEWLEN